MKEDVLETLRQQDSALRDALRMEEAELPQLPSDLNARLMQRVADGQKRTRKATARRLWPWLAAACVAAFIAVNIAPPKEPASPQPLSKRRGGVVTPKTEKVGEKVAQPMQPKVAEVVQLQIAEVKTVQKATVKPRKQQPETAETEPKVNHGDGSLQSEAAKPRAHDLQQQLAQTTPKVKMQTLTEHDIPITRPENYKYTPEELAQLRKQADEAYLKWVELELEISKNNLQQTAQQE